MITDLVATKIKTSQASSLSPAMKTFERLKKQVTKQQRLLTEHQKELEECLAYYYAKIEPVQKAIDDSRMEMTILFYQYYKGKKFLGRKQYHVFKEIIVNKVKTLCDSIPPQELPQEIKTMHSEFNIGDYDDMIEQDFAFMKQDMQQVLKEMFGVDFDLSAINHTDDFSEIEKKLDESLSKAKEKYEEPPCKPKSKKQLLKEQQKNEFYELQKRELGAIYRQLAKIVHPDLVQDPEEKLAKELLMKQLTAAYEKKDLHALLLLEMQWLNRASQQSSDDQVKIYNSLLKDQLESLNAQKAMISLDPRYYPIHPFTQDPAFSGKKSMIMAFSDLEEELAEYRHVIKELKSQNGYTVIREIVQEAMLFSQLHHAWDPSPSMKGF